MLFLKERENAVSTAYGKKKSMFINSDYKDYILSCKSKRREFKAEK